MKFFYHSSTTLLLSLILLFTGCSKKDVQPQQGSGLTIDPVALTVAKNKFISYPLSVKLNGVQVAADQITWVSNDPNIAKVFDNGNVAGVIAGGTDIVATLKNGKGSIKCHITVTDKNEYKFRLVLKDKGTSDFSIGAPEKFLSAKAIERRRRQNILINETDLPISAEYIKEIQKIGGVIVAQSKWLNTVSVHCTSESMMYKYKQLPFVQDVLEVWQSYAGNRESETDGTQPDANNSTYGAAFNNINTNKGQTLHDKGYAGEGMDIAVIDAGFKNINTNPTLNNIRIKGSKSFIYEYPNPFDTDSHGVWVTSCMATNKPGTYVGTAPGANYWLLRTEDQTTEFPIEEDYMVAALEYADSAGVDIVNTSLIYTYHDGALKSIRFNDTDGKTLLASRGANMAASKGIFIVAAAGNSSDWVGAPGESPNVLAVGAINPSGTITNFSSFGMTADGRMKPDIVALGGSVSVINTKGNAELRNGTSYSSPIICGLVACLWQAYPKLTNKQLLDIMRKSSNKYGSPLLPYGYGVTDMQVAIKLAQATSNGK
jgi:hypothetical protein